MKRIILITLLLILFALPLVLTEASRPASAIDPCCEIVSIDSVNGIVTARDLRTGETFKFEVDSRSLLKTMRVGQKVWKQAGGTKVGILEGESCCTIVGKGNASPGGRTASSTANASSGATIDGKTLILKKGYEASIDPKNKGVVRIRDVGLPARGATEYGCRCDPDEDTVSKSDTCAFYVTGDKITCKSPTCKRL